MAGEITFSALSDATISAALHQELLLKLGDRASLLYHPAIAYIGSINGSGSNVRKAAIWGAGLDAMSAPSDGAAVSNTAPTNANVQVTVARQALQYAPTDLAAMAWSFANPADLVMRLAADMATSAQRRFMSLLCDVIDGFAATVGSSGVDFSVTNWFSAQATLEAASAPGPFVAVLHPTQVTDLKTSLRAETGPLQWVPASGEMLAAKGQGFAGSFLGVDIYKSSFVPTANAGADRAGALMSYGAVAWADGIPAPMVGAGGVVINAGPAVVELERDASSALTKIVGNYYMGVALAQEGLGVSIITDA